MKKSLIIILLFVSFYNLNGQNQGTLLGGVNYSTIKHSDLETGYLIGSFVGFEFNYLLDNNYYLLAQPQYSRLGTTFTEDSVSGKMKVHYFKLPIKLKQYVDYNNQRLFFEGGPYVSLGGSGKLEINGDEENMYFKNLDFGLSAGVGIEFEQIKFSIGYDFGVYEIADFSDYQVYNRNIYLSIGLIW